MAQPERAPEPRPEPERSTISGIPYEPLYSPENTPVDYDAHLGDPGHFPFTRGIYETMYRGRAWTMRQFAGFGTAEETNRRFRYRSTTARPGSRRRSTCRPSWATDHVRSLGEVGREGVASTRWPTWRISSRGSRSTR
jgi:methylmalonyl-CoA mutase N-terminal domain/subunit